MRLPIVSDRACGECVACCTTLAVGEIDKPRDVRCEHVTERGCRVYAERPGSCRVFRCAWLARDSALLTTAFRPDRSGVVLWQEKTREGLALVAQETRAGALNAPAMRRLLGELARHRVLILRSVEGVERRG